MDVRKRKTILFLGMALFAMFFGAGNLLLPAYLGFQTRTDWTFTFTGFSLTAILAPVLAIFAVAVSGNYFTDLGARANVKLAYLLSLINVLCIGPLIALPRAGASVFEVAIQPIIPTAQPVWVCVLFFGAVMVASFSLNKITGILGKIFAPLLLFFLVLLILPGLFMGTTLDTLPTVIEDRFYVGFQEGYQTMDVLAGLIFAVLLIAGANRKGYTHTKDKIDVVVKSALLAAVCMLLVYGGLFYLGAHAQANASDVTRSSLLISIATQYFGSNGVYLISLLMLLACITTAIALTAGSANFFERLTKGKLGYIEGVISITLISIFLAITGVDTIIEYAAALLNFIYPVTLVLILSVLLFGKTITNQKPYFITLVVTMVISFVRVLTGWFPEETFLANLLHAFPMARYNLEWVLPAVLTFVISCFALGRNLNRR
ncbi:branched-chain amino acid transport system II carrier protein [Flavobacterium sp. CBA20B-1]|uniref:branched-chain amino acid transport system II carrier protein n=1 Tax=unclassified Flavobacterium TaxID=196869 RepID=UPI0022253F08|nr:MULTISPECIES: branched-chain amino acid transport system II carrier protein [unclassified Flavobacterium]WCM40947.1 branched-chain amino acid transport system II carrier protein [Flavobacterium sp. CBA20B-1]